MKSFRITLLALVLSSCWTTTTEQRVKGVRSVSAVATTSDGAEIRIRRWPSFPDARKILIIPELGFDSRLVEPLCVGLRDAGFDVATFDGREVTGRSGLRDGMSGWLIDAGKAVSAHGPKPLVVGIGVGGSVVWDLAQLNAVSGVLAINVPQHFELTNAALKQAMTEHLYDPARWLDSPYGAVLLTGSQRVPSAVLRGLARTAKPLSPEMKADVARMYVDGKRATLPSQLPLGIILSSSDNLVPTESAFLRETPTLVASRRLGRMETFNRNYGHLDWLVEEAAFEEVLPTIVNALEAMQ